MTAFVYQRAGIGRHGRGHRQFIAPIVARNDKSAHYHRREGDEMACSCGARWAVGEEHP